MVLNSCICTTSQRIHLFLYFIKIWFLRKFQNKMCSFTKRCIQKAIFYCDYIGQLLKMYNFDYNVLVSKWSPQKIGTNCTQDLCGFGYICLPEHNFNDFFRTLMYNMPVITVLFSLSWVVGMVIYAVYEHCDPLSYGYIKNLDEILPFYVEDRFSFFPGLLGLFMATLFNGALRLVTNAVIKFFHRRNINNCSLSAVSFPSPMWNWNGIAIVKNATMYNKTFLNEGITIYDC